MRKTIFILFACLLLCFCAGCTFVQPLPTATPAPTSESATSPGMTASAAPPDASLLYENDEYGFTIALPQSWQGYTIVNDKWEAHNAQGAVGETGPMVLVRHPGWTEGEPYQDIPIDVFTHDQWQQIQSEEINIGTAPINPSKLGENSMYIFALPARYNFSFPKGYEEVDAIVQSGAFQASENYKKAP